MKRTKLRTGAAHHGVPKPCGFDVQYLACLCSACCNCMQRAASSMSIHRPNTTSRKLNMTLRTVVLFVSFCAKSGAKKTSCGFGRSLLKSRSHPASATLLLFSDEPHRASYWPFQSRMFYQVPFSTFAKPSGSLRGGMGEEGAKSLIERGRAPFSFQTKTKPEGGCWEGLRGRDHFF